MKVKLSYLHENRKKESKLILKCYDNFAKFTDEMSFYRSAFHNICYNFDECDDCFYSKISDEDKCFTEYLKENDKEIEMIEN